jgi:hypothetical protein
LKNANNQEEVMHMSLDQKALFDVLSCAERNGVLEKLMVLLGQGIEEALEEGGLNTGDLLNMLDEAEDASLVKADGLLGMVGGFLPLANNDELMTFLSYLLEDPNVTTGMAQKVKEAILNNPAGQPPVSSK